MYNHGYVSEMALGVSVCIWGGVHTACTCVHSACTLCMWLGRGGQAGRMCGTKPMDAPSITIVCPWSMSYCTDTFVHTCAYAYTRMRTHADTHEHTHACTQVCGARMHACTHRAGSTSTGRWLMVSYVRMGAGFVLWLLCITEAYLTCDAALRRGEVQ